VKAFHRSIVVLLVISTLGFQQLACLGQGALGGKVLKFNLSVVQNKWSRWLVFLALNVIPVYPIAGAIDLVIINSIEFHTGTNPISGKPRLAVRDGHEKVVAPDGSHASPSLNADGSVTIAISTAEGASYTLQLVPVPGGVEARDGDGKYLGAVDSTGALRTAKGPIQIVPGT
jgi:hypothetical protein